LLSLASFPSRSSSPPRSPPLSYQEALRDVWLSGDTATDHNLLPEIRAYMAKARLRRGIEIVKLANRIEALRMREDEDDPEEPDVPANSGEAAGQALSHPPPGTGLDTTAAEAQPPATAATDGGGGKKSLSRIARGAIFREIVLAKVREMKEQEEKERVTEEARAKTLSRESSAQ
jgi:calcium/calmodulin-dependent protein kinase I